jgi:hypothetical protein
MSLFMDWNQWGDYLSSMMLKIKDMRFKAKLFFFSLLQLIFLLYQKCCLLAKLYQKICAFIQSSSDTK